nr:MAG TPA: hypothetical protein [Caudoviricetes sp.]
MNSATTPTISSTPQRLGRLRSGTTGSSGTPTSNGRGLTALPITSSNKTI